MSNSKGCSWVSRAAEEQGLKRVTALAHRILRRKIELVPGVGEAWMIGNSPKSDINPSLAAGLRAVFVPHPQTWTLEREEIRPVEGRLVVVTQFRDLLNLFDIGSDETASVEAGV
jgi:FMN phosphatase YigB (HAD superfamily)